jgi:fatty acid desaturase
MMSFFGGLSASAGHELLHNKEMIHKAVGSIPYALFFNSHYVDEHINGHHKHLGTDEDPVSHPFGTTIFYAIFSATIG